MKTPSGDTQVRGAICAHASWKATVEEGLDAGTLQASPHEILRSEFDACNTWLASLPSLGSAKSRDRLRMIKDLHAKFHTMAAEISAYAERGKHMEAKEKILSSTFNNVANSLIINLHDWRDDLTVPQAA